MRRLALPLLFAVSVAGCVSVAPLPDPRGALKPGQRLVVAVYVAPGPWILDAADSKAEAAAKISPVGFLMQSVQDEHTLRVSKDLQQYMPRPHYGLEVQDALMKELRVRISSGSLTTLVQAGIAPAQYTDWNKAKDQLDWRIRYFAPDPDAPAPRDYARALTLDDALILDMNVSYGITANDDGRLMPQMAAASRVYRGDTMHMIWEHEDEVTDQTSSSTLVEFKLSPADLTNRLEALSPRLAAASAASFVKAFGLTPSTAAAAVALSSSAPGGYGSGGAPPAPGGGLVPMAFFQNLQRSPSGPAATTPVASSAAPAAGVATSSGSATGAESSTTTAAGTSPVAVSSPAASVATSTATSPAH